MHRRQPRIKRLRLSLHFPPKPYECDCVLCEANLTVERLP